MTRRGALHRRPPLGTQSLWRRLRLRRGQMRSSQMRRSARVAGCNFETEAEKTREFQLCWAGYRRAATVSPCRAALSFCRAKHARSCRSSISHPPLPASMHAHSGAQSHSSAECPRFSATVDTARAPVPLAGVAAVLGASACWGRGACPGRSCITPTPAPARHTAAAPSARPHPGAADAAAIASSLPALARSAPLRTQSNAFSAPSLAPLQLGFSCGGSRVDH